MNIKLPVPITDVKTMLSFSTLHKLHHKKLLHQLLAFSGPRSIISRLSQHLSTNSGPFGTEKSKDEFWNLSGHVGTLNKI